MESLQSEAMRGSASRMAPVSSTSALLHSSYSDGDTDPAVDRSKPAPPAYGDALTLPTSIKGPRGRAAATDNAQPLPKGWSIRVDRTTGEPVYLDHVHRRTTWADPRSLPVGILPEKGAMAIARSRKGNPQAEQGADSVSPVSLLGHALIRGFQSGRAPADPAPPRRRPRWPVGHHGLCHLWPRLRRPHAHARRHADLGALPRWGPARAGGPPQAMRPR